MRVVILEWTILILLIVGAYGDNDHALVADYEGDAPLSETVCYLRCLSDALNKLYTDGEKKLLVNEEVYANVSRILDSMEAKTGESVKYLSVISGAMVGESEKLEKLISYGNTMGDLVAKVGGLFAEVNESVRTVRKEIPDALIKANKYYTSIAEIVRTVWDDLKAIPTSIDPKCENGEFDGVKEFEVKCGDSSCPLRNGVSEDALKHYKRGRIEVNVLNGSVSRCLNLQRKNLYKNGAEKHSSEVLKWPQDDATFFQLKLEVQSMFGPLIVSFAAGRTTSALLEMVENITSLRSRFKEIHSDFTSLLLNPNSTDNVNSTDSTI
ncbi:expression site-associated gene (ESAG) protein, putative [Trypanosoma brucei brucei TREU927]|uniref:Expression site-associated gene (ESAG) protein, putative n=1 Tax=Trypanosoma brucei brucei (strain 927/4 GUTat10.1) TaxID=185431 RepID=Q38CM4_TRYB2|nr:expression site-associated gene ESAG protein [Trypanosoma brucei brucei TREU927]EAN77446.1 expression site-associated gene (ESAG) protein, putative [Trypanosoma brucei brucei TREU927]